MVVQEAVAATSTASAALVPVSTIAGAGGDSGASVVAQDPSIAGASGDSSASVVAEAAVVATSPAAALVPVPTNAGAGGGAVASVVGQDAVDVLKLSAPNAEGRNVPDTVSQGQGLSMVEGRQKKVLLSKDGVTRKTGGAGKWAASNMSALQLQNLARSLDIGEVDIGKCGSDPALLRALVWPPDGSSVNDANERVGVSILEGAQSPERGLTSTTETFAFRVSSTPFTETRHIDGEEPAVAPASVVRFSDSGSVAKLADADGTVCNRLEKNDGVGGSNPEVAQSPEKAIKATTEGVGTGIRTPTTEPRPVVGDKASPDKDAVILGRWGPPDALQPVLLGTKKEYVAANALRPGGVSPDEVVDFRVLRDGAKLRVRWRQSSQTNGELLHAMATFHVQKSDYNAEMAAQGEAQVARLRFQGCSGVGSVFFYEGDVIVSTMRGVTAVNMAHSYRLVVDGSGSACSGPEGRELYRGLFARGMTVRDDTHLTGAVKGSYLGDLEKLYRTQVGMWVRAWRVDGEGPPTHFEVRRDSWDVKDTRTFRAYDMEWPHDVTLSPGQHWGGHTVSKPRDWSVPPGVIAWLSRKERRWYPWLGATSSRPLSVRDAVPPTDATDGLVYVTGWVMGESIYPWYESIQLRSGRRNTQRGAPRTTALEMGIGCWDTSATVYVSTNMPGGGGPSSGPRQQVCHDIMRNDSVYGMYDWGGVTTARNCVAIMYSPVAWMGVPTGKGTRGLDKPDVLLHGHFIGAPHYGAHAICQAFFNTRSEPSGGDGALDNRFALLFQGRPVGMPPDWGANHFGDLWRSALECPNVPVQIQMVRSVDRVVKQHRTMQLVDPVLLVHLDAASRTPGKDATTLWGDLAADFRMGASPVAEQALLLGLGGRSYNDDGTADDSHVTQRTMRSQGAVQDVLFNVWLPKIKSLDPLTAGEGEVPAGLGKTSRRLDYYLESISPQLFVLQGDCLRNMNGLTYVRGSSKSPFRIRLNKPANCRVAQAYMYDLEFAVSFTFLRRFYHPKLLSDAVRGLWYPAQFVQRPGGHASLLGPCSMLATQPETWEHGTFKFIGLVGSTGYDGVARCAPCALVAVLGAANGLDEPSQKHVRDTWPDWMDWRDMPAAVAGLNHFLAPRGLSHNLVKFKNKVDVKGPHFGRCIFDLLTSPLGRARLFQVGVRHLLVRPVTRTGWNLHVWGVVARDDGTWFVLDPDAGGETLKRVVLTGGLPGKATVQAAYALVTRVKGDIQSSRSKFVLPVAPTFDEASSHYRAFHVAAAFSAFAYHGLGQVCTINSIDREGWPHHRLRDLSLGVSQMWLIMLQESGLLQGGVRVELEPVAAGDLRSLWQRPAVGQPRILSEFVLLETEVDGGVANATAAYLISRPTPASTTAYFCPHSAMYKPATKSNIGIRHGRVWAWSIVVVEPLASQVAPEGSRSPVSTREPKQPAKRLKVSSLPNHSVDVPAEGVDETGSSGDGSIEQVNTLTRKAKDLDIGNL